MLQERVTSLETGLEGAKATIVALQGRIASLEADKAVMEADKAAIEYRSIERAFYRVWRQNPNFDFSSLGEHAIARAAEWNAHGRRP